MNTTDMALMGPTAKKAKTYAQSLSVAFVLVAASASNAQSQFSPPGIGSSVGAAADNEAMEPAGPVPWLTYGVDAGVGESDNVTLASRDKISQTVATTDADFVVKEQSRLLEAHATGDFSYLDYLQNAYGSQLIGRFDGQGTMAVVPGRLNWVVQENYGQAAINPYVAVTPTNMENINYFATGPDLFLRLGGINFIDLSARYARAQYQTSPYDSNRGFGSLAVGRYISAGASVSLNADFERVMFENTLVNDDFDRIRAFGGYELHGARTDFDVDLGASRISQEGPSITGPLAKVQLSRQLSAAAKLTLTAGRELTDAASSFSTLRFATTGLSGIIGTAPAALTSSNYTSDFASLGWQYLLNRTTIGLSARWEKDTYSSQPQLDVSHPGADFTLQRQLTRGFSAQLVGRWYRSDYPNAIITSSTYSSKYDDWLAGGALTWHHGHGLEINLRYNHSSRVAVLGGGGYSENRVFLTVGYRPRPATGVPTAGAP